MKRTKGTNIVEMLIDEGVVKLDDLKEVLNKYKALKPKIPIKPKSSVPPIPDLCHSTHRTTTCGGGNTTTCGGGSRKC